MISSVTVCNVHGISTILAWVCPNDIDNVAVNAPVWHLIHHHCYSFILSKARQHLGLEVMFPTNKPPKGKFRPFKRTEISSIW